MKKTCTLWLMLVMAVFIAGCGATQPDVRITTDALPSGRVASAYAAAIEARGGMVPYTWSLKKGSWPTGLALNPSTGSIVGAPAETGNFPVTVGVQDSSTPPLTTTHTLTLMVSTSHVEITTTSLPSGAVSVAYSSTLAATNGVEPYTWSLTSGPVPPGLSLQTDGQISGTPSQSGTFSVSVQAKDSSGNTGIASLSINIGGSSTPVVNGISPSTGPISGGTMVTISGANFASGATVTFGGAAASSVTISSDKQILAGTPNHIAGSVGVIVQVSGQSSSSSANFTYNALTPTVGSISPNNGPTAGGTKVTISGTNFLVGALVLFGSVSATSVTVNSATQIQAVTPPNAAGLATVTVENPGNLSANLASGFTYNASQSGPPTISSVAPTSGAPGTQVTITGTNFASADVVAFGTTNASPTTFVSATQLLAIVPSLSTGTYNLTVSDPNPASVTLNNGFTVTAPPPSQSLLAGMTPGKYTLPSGWTLAAAQDFESGSLPSGQTINSGASITCSFGHTGSCSATSTINFNGAADQWFFPQGQIKGHEVYLSYYDWAGGGATNEEYILSHFIKTGIGGAAGMEEAGIPMVSNNKFNNTCPNIAFGPQGNFVISPWEFGAVCYFTNTWTQWEFWLRANTPGNSDGFIRIYKNGVTYADQENINIFGSVDMTGMQVEAGGWYTKNVWTNNGLFPPSGTCGTFEGNGSEAGQWNGSFSTVGTTNCAPAPPIFNRYIDDIILLEK